MFIQFEKKNTSIANFCRNKLNGNTLEMVHAKQAKCQQLYFNESPKPPWTHQKPKRNEPVG